MFNIDLTAGQKLQIGFISAILLAAGFFFIRDTRSATDMTISAHVDPPHHVGLDPSKPISEKNPVDPAKTTTMNNFWCHDGHLEIVEYAPESGLKVGFAFAPDLHRTSYDFYHDPLKKINAIGDPYKRILTLAAYSAANNLRSLHLLGNADLDAAQLQSEKASRQTMLDAITLMEQEAKTGDYHPEIYNKVLAVLAAYNKLPGDPLKDKKKAAAAHEVVNLAMAYIERLNQDKIAAVDKYVAAVDGILTAPQKTKLTEVSQQMAGRQQQQQKRRRSRAG